MFQALLFKLRETILSTPDLLPQKPERQTDHLRSKLFERVMLATSIL